MKRYALFTFCGYDVLGGWDDYESSFNTEDEAHIAATEFREKYDYGSTQIIDLHTGRKVECKP